MTQIIVAVTSEYALLAADRRLTFLSRPQKGQIADDDTCKLVSLCNICGIGFTGVAEIEGSPTHEWIAKTLAHEQCTDPATASRILSERARSALSSVPLEYSRQTFVITGWAYFKDLTGLRPHVCAITNMLDISGRTLAQAQHAFAIYTKALRDDEDLSLHIIGQPLVLERGQRLERNLRMLITREISANAAIRRLVDEIIHSSGLYSTVGKKVLCLCIPRRAVQASIASGLSAMLASQPCDDKVTFCYYDPAYSELQQFGPTTTCGGFAMTDLNTQSDPTIGFQKSETRILAMPKKSNQSTPQNATIFK
jgi:hypothetical protein